MSGPSLESQRYPDHTPLTNEGWYEFKPHDAHVWMDIPPRYPDPNHENQLVPAMYLKAMIQDGTPLLRGCQGQGQNIYSELLCARPFHAAGNRLQHFDADLKILKDPLDPRVERSLLFLGDLGVLGDIYLLRTLPLRMEGLLR
jgi:hypothetical protein